MRIWHREVERMQSRHAVATVEDYEPFIGQKAVDRILSKGRQLTGRSIAHVNSSYYGGGVAGMLSSLTLLMRSLGLDAEWRAIQGPPDFFSITKTMHNALQGAPIRLTDIKKEIYEDVAFQNALRNRFDHDYVVVHDPQPLPLVQFSRKRGPWIWRCHVEVAQPSHACRSSSASRPSIPSASSTASSRKGRWIGAFATMAFPRTCRWWFRSRGSIAGRIPRASSRLSGWLGGSHSWARRRSGSSS
jgi:hypothetical protein